MYITHEIEDMKNMNNWSAFPLIKDIDDAFVLYMTRFFGDGSWHPGTFCSPQVIAGL